MDSRFQLAATLTIYGKTYKTEMNLNWTAEAGEVDQRITDWLLECHADAIAHFNEEETKAP